MNFFLTVTNIISKNIELFAWITLYVCMDYGLDGPGIHFRWGRDFPRPSRPALGPTRTSLKWETALFPGVKWPGPGANHPLPSSAEVKERVQLYLYYPSGPSWSVLGRTLPLPFSFFTSCQSLGWWRNLSFWSETSKRELDALHIKLISVYFDVCNFRGLFRMLSALAAFYQQVEDYPNA